MTRAIRYNRTPESARERSEAQRRRRPIARTVVCDESRGGCGQPFTPRVGNQKRCPRCIETERLWKWIRQTSEPD